MLNEKFEFCFKTTKWNLSKAPTYKSPKSAKYKTHMIKSNS